MRAWRDVVCDKCGEPATVLARDVREMPPQPGDNTVRYEPTRTPLKAGCPAHPVESLILPKEGATAP